MGRTAVIFDMDGVLIDACDLHRKAFAAAIKHVVGYEITEEDEGRLEGLPSRNKLLLLSNQGKVDHVHHDAVNVEKQYRTHTLIKTTIVERQPVTALLQRLNRAGVKVGVVTNCSRGSAVAMLQIARLLPLIDILITNEDVERPKPDPEGLQKAMKALNVSPEDVIYIGDQPIDSRTAYNAGVYYYLNVESPNEVCWELLRCRLKS
jgi:HAD superfamily hydrolase (TIGR01549 family)